MNTVFFSLHQNSLAFGFDVYWWTYTQKRTKNSTQQSPDSTRETYLKLQNCIFFSMKKKKTNGLKQASYRFCFGRLKPILMLCQTIRDEFLRLQTSIMEKINRIKYNFSTNWFHYLNAEKILSKVKSCISTQFIGMNGRTNRPFTLGIYSQSLEFVGLT